MVQKRDIVTCIILSFVTCSIYGFIWFVNITNDVCSISEENDMNGSTCLLLNIITFGLYGIYWSYMMGKKIAKIQEKKSDRIEDNSVLYLVLSIFGLQIVNYCLIQNEINKYAK